MLLTVFTPTYNRAHTLSRTYESLKRQSCHDFEWLVIDDGSTDNTRQLISTYEKEQQVLKQFLIRYIYKENGGLYTGYNTAYANITNELSICIDSDDYMPDDAIELIIEKWKSYRKQAHCDACGILALDFDVTTGNPIGGYFPEHLSTVYLSELRQKNYHSGDMKMVLRTDLMKAVAPMIGFEGEKNFNPIYMIMQVCDKYPLLVLNKNLCWVEYQTTGESMSRAIFRQYINSPRSFAKMRLMEMTLKRATMTDKFRSCVHYVSSCMISKDREWLKKSPLKFFTILASPFGFLLSVYIRYKTIKH